VGKVERSGLVELAREASLRGRLVARDEQALVELVRDPKVDAIWLTAPNHVRVEMIETICEEVASGRAELIGIAVAVGMASAAHATDARTTRMILIPPPQASERFLSRPVFSREASSRPRR
jgi:hypothetical protein